MCFVSHVHRALASRSLCDSWNGTKEEYFAELDKSRTLYVGNLSFYTSEEQVRFCISSPLSGLLFSLSPSLFLFTCFMYIRFFVCLSVGWFLSVDAVCGACLTTCQTLLSPARFAQIYELFSTVGDVKRIIMGLDRASKTPCGFCFIEYYSREGGEAAMRYVNGTMLDERLVRTDWDPGFLPSRQYGRGASGGQVRDEYRPDYDAGRGGYGRQYQQRDAPEAYTEFQPDVPTAGAKRGRDEDDEDVGGGADAIAATDIAPEIADAFNATDDGGGFAPEDDGLGHASKNPRFRRENDDDDDDDDDDE